jgi:hypothetical protein
MNGEITYTFSRALHLMRYGGAKMKPIDWNDGYYLFVKNNNIVQYEVDSSIINPFIDASELMGEWVEVK